ncbi:hypothetical protein WN944_015148 [Citrus x changshan-huyou]|uniref:K-box domain-containing protein n=1 Tax=Citrus x changshan-huyou TaxID=2935761 RepID=A0AAP0QM96_9ROSI
MSRLVNDDGKLKSYSSDLGESNGVGSNIPRVTMVADRAPKAVSFPAVVRCQNRVIWPLSDDEDGKDTLLFQASNQYLDRPEWWLESMARAGSKSRYYQQESAKLRQQIQMSQNSNRHLMGDSLSALIVKELKQLKNKLERGITRISSKKAPISRSVTTTPIRSRSVTTTPVRLLDHDPPPNNLSGYDSGLIYN